MTEAACGVNFALPLVPSCLSPTSEQHFHSLQQKQTTMKVCW